MPISVEWFYDSALRLSQPRSIWWQGKKQLVEKVGLHHTYREGRVLMHVFSIVGRNIFFRVELNTETLNWRLKEVADGLPD